MNAKTAASLFLSAKGVWGIDELVGLLRKGFAGELQLCSGSENRLRELEAKAREGFGEKRGTLADAAGVKRSKDARKAFILVSAHLLRMPVANHALQDGRVMKKVVQSAAKATSSCGSCHLGDAFSARLPLQRYILPSVSAKR